MATKPIYRCGVPAAREVGPDDPDRCWFERRPHRQYRLRLARPWEAAGYEVVYEIVEKRALPPGARCCVAVCKTAPDEVRRVGLMWPEDAGTEINDALARYVLEAHAPEYTDMMRRAANRGRYATWRPL